MPMEMGSTVHYPPSEAPDHDPTTTTISGRVPTTNCPHHVMIRQEKSCSPINLMQPATEMLSLPSTKLIIEIEETKG